MIEGKKIETESRVKVKVPVPDFSQVPETEPKGFSNTEMLWVVITLILILITIGEFIYFPKN